MVEGRYFQALCLLTAAWSVLQAADLSLTDIDEKVAVMKLKFTVAPFISVAVFGLLASHSGQGSMLTRRNLLLISALPLASVLMAYTAEMHSLFIYDFRTAGQSILEWSVGPLFWVYFAATYGMILWGLALLVRSVKGANPLYQKQAAVLSLALLPPSVLEILAGVEMLPTELEHLTLAAFAMSAVIMSWGLYSFRILDIRPIARGEVVDNMVDAMLIVDLRERIIDLNRSAEQLLLVPPRKALGAPLDEAVRSGEDITSLLRSSSPHGEITAGAGLEQRTYDASVMPVEVGGELRARMVLLRDITKRHRTEEALRAANSRMDILSSLTRHDLLNRLAVIDGYIALAAKETNPEKLRTYLSKMERSNDAARMLIEFAGDYQSVGIKAPAWLSVDDLFARAVLQHHPEGIEVAASVDGVTVYADAMLEKVFYNLVDNTVRHGGTVTRISLEYEEHGDRLSLVYRDDGIGVPGREKPLIFLREFGVNTGLGLFLAREVLAITGIEIVENGDEGKGARFEMQVPRGGYRIEQGAAEHRASREAASAAH